MQGENGAALPCFLARGRGHGAFKKKLMEVCDEIFVIAPLGKILIGTSVGDLNTRLHYSSDAANPQERSYELIQAPVDKSPVFKVVSTIREKQSVLRDHSALLCKKLGPYTTLDRSDRTNDQASSSIADVDHLLFPFDKFCDETIETQLEIELPHPRTRENSFKRDVFSIRS
jgi:hypothetical protein